MSDISFDSPSVQSYLTILQGVINRMAANSAGCKTWCIALVSAIILVVADQGQSKYVWISLVPIVLFFFLDAYYLGLERRFREQHNMFIRKIHSGKMTLEDVFILSPSGGTKAVLTQTMRSFSSISVWPFYGLLALMLAVIRLWVL